MRKIALFLVFLVTFFFSACSVNSEQQYIVASLFPQYSIAKIIAKDKLEVRMLLKPAMDAHSFDPSAGDIWGVINSAAFLYGGELSDPMAHKITTAARDINICDVSSGIELIEEHGHDGHDHDHDHDHEHGFDAHFWLNLQNAVIMANNIYEAIVQIDGDNKDFYKNNLDALVEELNALDNEFEVLVHNAKKNGKDTLVFGGKFAYLYFLERYDLCFETAYSTCEVLVEPSANDIVRVSDFIKDNNIPVIFYEEFSQGFVAKAIAAQTNASAKVFHTAHNVSAEDLRAGKTFLDIMRDNYETVKEALS